MAGCEMASFDTDIINHDSKECRIQGCENCALNRPFDLPPEIVNASRIGNLVIFAGAGVSTEGRNLFSSSFYEQIKRELNLPQKTKISFPKLMSLYCSSPRSRKDLYQEIKKRIDYVKAFPELYRKATDFHRELSTIPHLEDIFTTNWDDFFERECDATPIVTGEDFAILNDIPGRKIFKLHGSIHNYGSVVATEEDYRDRYRKMSSGIIGAKLKMLLVSKTFVFFGFSFEDEDFKRLYRVLKKDVAGLMPRSYVVTLDEQAKDKLNSLGINAIPIVTSSSFFLKQLKEKLVSVEFMLPDHRYNEVDQALQNAEIAHERTSGVGLTKHPDSIYSLFYQDGLIHAFERLLATKNSGVNSCPSHVCGIIDLYSAKMKELLHERNYLEVAYLTGYQTGLIHFLMDEKDKKAIPLPLFFLFGCDQDIITLDQYTKLERGAAKMHKSANKMALAIAKAVDSKKLIIHHRPFIQ